MRKNNGNRRSTPRLLPWSQYDSTTQMSQTQQKHKENYSPISQSYIDSKTFNKVLTNRILAQNWTCRSMEPMEDTSRSIYNLSLYLTKTQKTYCEGEKSISNKLCRENGMSTYRRMESDLCLAPYTQTNSKWMEDLNMTTETLKLLEENIGSALRDVV